jgi:hypothetical protein
LPLNSLLIRRLKMMRWLTYILKMALKAPKMTLYHQLMLIQVPHLMITLVRFMLMICAEISLPSQDWAMPLVHLQMLLFIMDMTAAMKTAQGGAL